MRSNTTDKDIAPPLDLRTPTLGLLAAIEQRTPEQVGIYSIDTPEHGIITVSYADGAVYISYRQYNRFFTYGADHVLVENVTIPDPTMPIMASTSQEEGVFQALLDHGNYPDKIGKTEIVPYDFEENDLLCMITRTKVGVMADFIGQDVQLFYNLVTRKMQPYKEPPPIVRDAQAKKEREYVRLSERADMVEQQGYNGAPELVNKIRHSHQLLCECGNIRWISESDVFQCCYCKPCTARKKRERKRERIRGK